MSNIIKLPFARTSDDEIGEIELGLLSILITKPEKLLQIKSFLKAEAFMFVLHRHAFEVICDASFRGIPLDARSLPLHMADDVFLKANVNKFDFIGDLLAIFSPPEQIKPYARSMMEAWHRRRIRFTAIADMDEAEKAQDMAQIARDMNLSESAESLSLAAALDAANDTTGDLYRAGGGYAGLETHLADLDRQLCGLEHGGLYVVAGRPAMGKSALGITIGLNVAQREKPVLFFSLEMSAEQIAHRVNARYANVQIYNQKTGRNIDFSALQVARDYLNNVPFSIVEKSGVTAEWIAETAKENARLNQPSLIIIDHLGIVAARDARTPRVQQVGEMTAIFKTLAKELHCPVILLHQLNRAVEGRDDKRPGLSDLRDSGSVEQDADAVIMIYREEYYLNNTQEPAEAAAREKWHNRRHNARNKAELIIAKNRQGETGIVTVRFDGAKQLFENFA